ncbi:MAG: hypothetical protein L3J24_02150 [Xanthomonadales bacterium]|nr:hypothetical protein [Xanthomonadales bacterium]
MTIADFGNGKELAVGIPDDNSSDDGDGDGDGDNDAGSVEVFGFRKPELIVC